MAGSSGIPGRMIDRDVVVCKPGDTSDQLALKIFVPENCTMGWVFDAVRQARGQIGDTEHRSLLWF